MRAVKMTPLLLKTSLSAESSFSLPRDPPASSARDHPLFAAVAAVAVAVLIQQRLQRRKWMTMM